jgi:hypothetical protein
MFSSTVKITEAMIETAIMARQLGRNIRMRVSFRTRREPDKGNGPHRAPEGVEVGRLLLDQAS